MLKERKYVYAIYEQRSFSRAAEQLFISQPALSAVIKRLEKELGTFLFDRSTNPITMTEAGEYYIASIEKIMAIEKNMKCYFQDLQKLDVGTLKIATGSFFCNYSLPVHLKPFIERYPGIRLEFVENYNYLEVEKLLHKGTVDFVLSPNPVNFENYSRQFFGKEQLILAVPTECEANKRTKEYRLSFREVLGGRQHEADCPRVSLASFAKEKFILLKPGSDLYQRSHLLFQNAGIDPEISMYLDQMPTTYHMSCNGFGISIIRDLTLEIVPAPKKDYEPVVFYKIDDELAARDIYFFYRKDMYLSAAGRAFLNYTKETCGGGEDA